MYTFKTEPDNKYLTKKEFYTLSWTWGLLLNVIGLLVISTIIIYGKLKHNRTYELKKCGWCYYLAVGDTYWGGLELGMFFLTDKSEHISTKWHEHGHAIQNCYLGLFMPLLVSIPSAIRYWYRNYLTSKGQTLTTKYDDIWFEGEATKLGKKYKAKYFN
jgi:hypothetical protein